MFPDNSLYPGHVYFAFDNFSLCSYFFYMESLFEPLKFCDELKAADVPDKQARAQAEAMRNAFAAYDAGRMKELVTKSDLRDAELRIINWTIGIIVTQTALLVAIISFLR